MLRCRRRHCLCPSPHSVADVLRAYAIAFVGNLLSAIRLSIIGPTESAAARATHSRSHRCRGFCRDGNAKTLAALPGARILLRFFTKHSTRGYSDHDVTSWPAPRWWQRSAPANDVDGDVMQAFPQYYDICVIANDIYTKEDAEILMRAQALPLERIMGVETTAPIRPFARIVRSTSAIELMKRSFRTSISSSSNPAATTSPRRSRRSWPISRSMSSTSRKARRSRAKGGPELRGPISSSSTRPISPHTSALTSR